MQSEGTVLKYLLEINRSCTILVERITALERDVFALGVSCQKAFHQVRVVVDALASEQRGTREDLSEVAGTGGFFDLQ